MNDLLLNLYKMVSVLIAIVDIVLAIKAFGKKSHTGLYLGLSCVGAAVVDISYLVSIITDNYLCMSVMSSIYFVTIDTVLVCLLVFTVYFTKGSFTKFGKAFIGLCTAYTLFEVVVFAVNPFSEIAIHYIPRDTVIAKYAYEMEFLYIAHLVFTYSLVATVIMLLIRKMLRIPHEYRAQYRFVIIGIIAIVAVNGVFLFSPNNDAFYSLLDYSICGYSLTACLLYWSCFNYSTHGMLNTLKTSIFGSIEQGIVLFDYDNQLILHNERADELLGIIDPEKCSKLSDFLQYYDLPPVSEADEGLLTVQCYVKDGEKEHPLRCDIRSLTNKHAQRLGQLFVFSDAALETDLLTGFQDWQSFQMFVGGNQSIFTVPTGVAIFDINSLSVINSTLGYDVGNQRIRMLADAMRGSFPKQTYYVRGLEANLIALCIRTDADAMHKYVAKVKEIYTGTIQEAVCVTEDDSPDVLSAIKIASESMRAKKLLDRDSSHSGILTSLIRTLQECDSDTEHHVRRTQLMGAELGKRIGLTESDQSRLALLCLLHDIGKIGIPLEILNKPGKLSDEEWKIIQTHTEKGYEIANSNNELRVIADEIRHHHERWDGMGYPDGLSRESIPLLARVIAVVDAFDAMTNRRSYRGAMSVASAIDELKRCAGSQFDPHIVSEFLSMLKENPPAEPDRESTAITATESPAENTLHMSEADECTSVYPVQYSRYILDSSMRIIDVDENFEKLTGYSAEDIRLRDIYQADLIPKEERTEYLCHTSSCLAKNTMLFQEHRIQKKDGSTLYVMCFGRVYFDSVVRSERSEIIIADIRKTQTVKMITDEEQNKAQIRLKQWENTFRRDSLTGLLNHAAFRSDVELRLLDGTTKVMMLMMDIDKFKNYNDTYGHFNGDKLLISVAQALKSALDEDDCVCRMGGDEFAVAVFFNVRATDAETIAYAQKIFEKVSQTLKNTEGDSGISMGMAMSVPDSTFTQLYEASDKALYQAKQDGRGRLVIG